MTEFLGKERNVISDDSKVTPDRIPSAQGTESSGASGILVTPPPADTRTASVASAAATARAPQEERVALFAPNESNDLRSRWDSIQVNFVDEPRKSVEEADALVSATMKRLTEIFAAERQALEQQWDQSPDISTEDLRVALRRYRSFFGRLLSM